MQSHHLLNIAIDAARDVGRMICQKFDRLDTLDSKIIDKLVAQFHYLIENHYPNHNINIMGEFTDNNGDCTWFIDPINGLNNYLQGYQQVAIAIAIEIQGKVTHSLIYNPISQDLYTASLGNGARYNDRRMRVSNTKELSSGILSLELDSKYLNSILLKLKAAAISPDIRINGCPALALAETAAGHSKGFIGYNINKAVILAGSLLIRESGGFFGGLDPEDNIANDCIIAANRSLYPSMCDFL